MKPTASPHWGFDRNRNRYYRIWTSIWSPFASLCSLSIISRRLALWDGYCRCVRKAAVNRTKPRGWGGYRRTDEVGAQSIWGIVPQAMVKFMDPLEQVGNLTHVSGHGKTDQHYLSHPLLWLSFTLAQALQQMWLCSCLSSRHTNMDIQTKQTAYRSTN